MSNEQENFEKLRLLLTIKRYEQPPPGYFDRLPSQIIGRIRAGETDSAWAFGPSSWLQRIWAMLDTKPVLAGSMGVAVCGLLLAGLAFNMAPETQPSSSLQVFAGNSTPIVDSPLAAGPSTFRADMPAFATGTFLAATGSVVSLAPQSAYPQARHPYAMTLDLRPQ